MAQATKKEAPLVPKLRFKEFVGDGEWVEKKIGSILTIGNGRDYKHLNKGNFPVYGTGGYMLSVDDYLHDGTSVCIGRKGTIDKPFILNGKFWTVDTLFYTHSYKQIFPIFLYMLFQNINWQNYNAASGVPSLSKDTIYEITVPIPREHEQQRIIDCLTFLDENITAESQKLEALTTHKKALMQKLFPTEGEKVPALRFMEFTGAREWEEKRLDTLAIAVNDKALSNDASPALTLSGELGLIVQNDYFGRRVASQDRSKSIKIIENDFVYNDRITAASKYGTIKKLHCIESGLVSPIYKCFRFNKKEIFSFWECYFTSGMHESELKKLVNEGAREGRYNISISKFLSINALRPSIQEQQRIADCLSSLGEYISAQGQKIALLKEHKKGLMQQLFPRMEEENV